jgi:hypothetical protein
VSHVRTQIRNAVAALLPGTVYKSRVWPVEQTELPVLLVYTGSEADRAGDMQSLERTLDVIVECVTQGTDDEMDAQFVLVEQALADTDLGGLALMFTLTGIEVTVSAEGSAPIGRGRMTYSAMYRTTYADPETSI